MRRVAEVVDLGHRVQRVGKQLDAGMLAMNDFATTYPNQSLPMGGLKDSGFGKFAGVEGIRGCCVAKAVVQNKVRFISTPIPLPLHYPLSDVAFPFMRNVLEFFYGPTLARKLGGVAIAWSIMILLYTILAGMSGAPLSLDGYLATTLVALFFGYGAIHTVGAYHDDEALRQLGCPPADGAKCSVGGEAYTVRKTEGTCEKVPEICLPAGMMWQLHMAPLFGTHATGVAERPVPSAGGARAPIPATPLDALKALDRPEGGGQETLEMYLARRLDPEHFAALDPVTRAYVEEHKRLKVRRDSEYMEAIATPCSGIEPYHDSWLNAWARSFALSGKAEVECERKRRLAALLDTAKHGPGGKPS